MGMFESCCGGARQDAASEKKKSGAAFDEIDEETDGISLGNGWQRWIDFEERRYYYSRGGTTTWDEPRAADLVEPAQRKK